MINSLFEKTKPQCIGRYIIDVPESFNNQLQDSVYIEDFKIESQFIYPPAFKQRIELREKDLRDWIPSAENAPALKEIIQLPDNNGIIFDRNKSGSKDAYRILEAHVYLNHISFIITTDFLDLSSPKYAEEKKYYIDIAEFTEAETNTKHAKIATMKSLISRLSGRLDDEIPTEKGICIPNGFILDNSDEYTQEIKFIYKNNEFTLSVDVNNNYPASNDTLFNREIKINSAMVQQGMKTIKKESLLPNGLPSQEWLMKGEQEVYSEKENKKKPNMPYYQFWLYANQETATLTMPRVLIKLNNVDKFTNYSEAQMIEIWDRIVNSLRYCKSTF